MGFDGLIFTDAMDMYAIDRRYGRQEAAVRALEAGADVILMPPSPAAARGGDRGGGGGGAAVRRSGWMRRSSGSSGPRRNGPPPEPGPVPVEEVARKVGIPEHEAVAQEVADRSITLLKNEGISSPSWGPGPPGSSP